jgi:pyruvate/2-oxoglutarate dehydrogenase complex dihydrolipoamide acyltransferase (E2) component
MATPIVVPELGGGALALSLWYAEPGDRVLAGERVVEVLAGAATFEVTAPVSGTLREKRAFPRDQLVPGQVLGLIEEA